MNHKLTVASNIHFCASKILLLWIIKNKNYRVVGGGFRWLQVIRENFFRFGSLRVMRHTDIYASNIAI